MLLTACRPYTKTTRVIYYSCDLLCHIDAMDTALPFKSYFQIR